MKKGALIDRYKKVVTPVLGHYNDLEIRGGKGAYLFGIDGKKYLDFSCGIAVTSLGHCHPKVTKSVEKQIKNLVHICIGVAYYEKYIELAEKLKEITPKELEMSFFCQDGTGAVEAALKLAKYVSKKQGIICFTGSFHGRTYASMSVTTSKEKFWHGYEPLMPNVYTAPYPYCYRCKTENGLSQSPDKCVCDCLNKTEELINCIGSQNIAAMIIEPIQGEGGYIVPPHGYLKKLKCMCERNDIYLIFDEIQSGMGRTGKMFAFEHFNIVPDIMCLAKGIANGFPLGAVIAKKEIMEKWNPSAHGTTFGGNPVSCAASLAAIETIENEKLLKNAQNLGKYLIKKLKVLQKKHKFIGDVRGLGLMIGVEFIKENGDPDSEIVKKILKNCLDTGLLLISCGSHDQVIRFIPPLNVTKKQIDIALSIFKKALSDL